jgi:hypothetical protein
MSRIIDRSSLGSIRPYSMSMGGEGTMAADKEPRNLR